MEQIVLTKATEIIKVYELWDIFSFTVVIIIIRIQIKSLHKHSHTNTVSNLSAAQECLQRVCMGNISAASAPHDFLQYDIRRHYLWLACTEHIQMFIKLTNKYVYDLVMVNLNNLENRSEDWVKKITLLRPGKLTKVNIQQFERSLSRTAFLTSSKVTY